MVVCSDIAGDCIEVGPVCAVTPVAKVRREVAEWKGVETYRVELAHGLMKLQDCLTLQSAGIGEERDISVIIKRPSVDERLPPRSLYAAPHDWMDEDEAEEGARIAGWS